MKATIRDSQVLGAIRLANINSYLTGRQWVRVSVVEGRYEVWGQPDESRELVVPARESFADYASRMGELLLALSMAEERPQPRILQDIEYARSDAIRIRVDAPQTRDGTISLVSIEAVVPEARNLVMSAALEAAIGRPALPTLERTDRSDATKTDLRFGQTERGSFILTILIPLVPQQVEFPFPSEEVPFPRQATRCLALALSRIEEALQQDEGSPDPQQLNRGVCSAVASMMRAVPETNQFNFRLGWAAMLPEPASEFALSLSGGAIDQLDAIGSFRTEEEAERERGLIERNVTARGHIVELRRPRGSFDGRVVIEATSSASVWRRLRVALAEPDYESALEAHRLGTPVRVRGDLYRRGNYYTLEHPQGLVVGA